MKDSIKPDKRLAAICGLFCPSCTIYIGSKEDFDRLKKLSIRLNQSIEETRCEGCRSKKRTSYCKTCKMAVCAQKRRIDFCIECNDYPCDNLKEFQSLYAHRIELWQSQERIKEAGYEKWLEEMTEHFSCPKCGAINSAFDLACRKCGKEPSCSYVEKNKQEIINRNSIKTLVE
ncbi:MAG: hypothetical protein APF77_06710 [Clostridia bacterium BRH_c25]|nr:MAG: hypothetical protein APF77_06710 [Clostridia bacterium BRH_c25]